MRLFHLPDGGVMLKTPKRNQSRTFPAVVARVGDGDTFVGDLDLGLCGLVSGGRRMRLVGGNAREARAPHTQPGGPEAAANLAARLPPGTNITVQVVSETADPHGRLLVTVALFDGTDLVEELIEQQWMAAWDGRGEAPVPPWPRTVP